MKTFKLQAAQGDMLIVRVDPAAIPAGAKLIPAENGAHILAHSETGHHHLVLERPGIQHFQGMDVLRSLLVIPEGEPVPIKHMREAHTHETILLEPGVYEIRRQREFDVSQGWRLAAD